MLVPNVLRVCVSTEEVGILPSREPTKQNGSQHTLALDNTTKGAFVKAFPQKLSQKTQHAALENASHATTN